MKHPKKLPVHGLSCKDISANYTSEQVILVTCVSARLIYRSIIMHILSPNLQSLPLPNIYKFTW